jgi:hypothetical protein|nr:MAG TPA: hypothetical protein [Caudoviricetes sp.]
MEKLKIIFNTGYLSDEVLALSKTFKLNELTNEKDIVQTIFNYLDKKKKSNKIIRLASNSSIVFYSFRLYVAKNYEDIDITYQFNFKNGKHIQIKQNKKGDLFTITGEDLPDGFFDTIDNILLELILN